MADATANTSGTNGNTTEDDFSDTNQETQEGKQHRLIVVEPALILYFTVLISSAPLINQWIYDEVSSLKNFSTSGEGGVCDEIAANRNDSNYLLQQEVQATAANWNIYLELAELFPSLFASLFLGPISDIVGRKISIMLPIIGLTIRFIFFISVMAWKLPLYLLLVGEFLQGMFGGPSSIVTACFAYLADVYTGRQRTLRITILDVLFGMVGSVANIGMGYLIQGIGFYYPFFLLTFVNLINLVYAVVGIPESDKVRSGVKLLTLDRLTKSFQVINKPSIPSNKWKIVILILSFSLSGTMLKSRMGLQTLFVLNIPLCWGPVLIGYFSAYSSVLMNLGNFVVTYLFVNKLTEVGVVIVGCVSGALSLLLFSASVTTWMVFLVPVVGIASFVVRPMLRAEISNIVPAYELGALFAGIAAIERICSTAGSSAMNALYGETLFIYKGLVFVVLALTYIIIIGLMIYYKIRKRKESIEDNKSTSDIANLKCVPNGHRLEEAGSIQNLNRLSDISFSSIEHTTGIRENISILYHSPHFRATSV